MRYLIVTIGIPVYQDIDNKGQSIEKSRSPGLLAFSTHIGNYFVTSRTNVVIQKYDKNIFISELISLRSINCDDIYFDGGNH